MSIDLKFPVISGNISIDLVNTEIVRHGTRHDLLTQREHVIAWFRTLVQHEIINPKQFQETIDQWADEALPLLREMRILLREQFEQLADGQDVSPNFIDHLQQCIKKAPFAFELVDNTLFSTPMGAPQLGLISLLARDVLELFASNDIHYMKRCANPACVLLFIDRRGRRKWCSMKICGNREKVSRFQQQKN